jgi:hypothetical protein
VLRIVGRHRIFGASVALLALGSLLTACGGKDAGSVPLLHTSSSGSPTSIRSLQDFQTGLETFREWADGMHVTPIADRALPVASVARIFGRGVTARNVQQLGLVDAAVATYGVDSKKGSPVGSLGLTLLRFDSTSGAAAAYNNYLGHVGSRLPGIPGSVLVSASEGCPSDGCSSSQLTFARANLIAVAGTSCNRAESCDAVLRAVGVAVYSALA